MGLTELAALGVAFSKNCSATKSIRRLLHLQPQLLTTSNSDCKNSEKRKESVGHGSPHFLPTLSKPQQNQSQHQHAVERASPAQSFKDFAKHNRHKIEQSRAKLGGQWP